MIISNLLLYLFKSTTYMELITKSLGNKLRLIISSSSNLANLTTTASLTSNAPGNHRSALYIAESEYE